MRFPEKYKVLKSNSFSNGGYSIVPIRYDDRFKIMEWRNEQMYHLRQNSLLTIQDQENYFQNVVANLFDQERPCQILFSYLRNEECIGYGGLVHINWIDKNAEISFIMKTELEQNEFKKHWRIYLELIEQLAFQQLKFHKIFTYAFDLRPRLYNVLEKSNFTKEAVLKNHCFFNNEFIDVVIHSKFKDSISIRKINSDDLNFTYLLSNDALTRSNSYNSEPIAFHNHENWFEKKLQDDNAFYFIGQFNSQPAAFIRIDLSDIENIIGITINKEFRGKGLSAKFLKQTISKFNQLHPNKIITAYIKIDNIPSIKTFEKAGFNFIEECTIENCSSKKYTI